MGLATPAGPIFVQRRVQGRAILTAKITDMIPQEREVVMRGTHLLSALVLLSVVLLTAIAPAADVTFTLEPPVGFQVESVSVRGSFNDWSESPMEQGDEGLWSLTLDLKEGECLYKFFINGEWPGDMETWLDGGPVDLEAEGYVDDGFGGQNAVRTIGGAAVVEEVFGEAPELADGHARIHYHRPRAGYGGWGLHLWGDTTESVEWMSPFEQSGRDAYGVYWDVSLTDGAESVGFIVHRGDSKDPGPDMSLVLSEHGNEIWLVTGRTNTYTEEPDVAALALGDLSRLRAHWVDESTIAWRLKRGEGNRYFLHSSSEAGLELTTEGVVGGETIELVVPDTGLSAEVKSSFPHLKGLAALRLPEDALSLVPELLKGQLAVSVIGEDGGLVDATGVQIPGVLDELFSYRGPLGVTWNHAGAPFFHVWAPTAQSVQLHVFNNSGVQDADLVIGMVEQDGVWTAPGHADWKGRFYLYEVTVYFSATGGIESTMVTDPYSRSLSANGTMSQIIDLDDPDLKPTGWDELTEPALDFPVDIVLYELHVRDFSATDPTVPEEFAGTFKAFTVESNGVEHLKGLAEAGVTHIHLLPAFDIATVNENRSEWENPGDLTGFARDSEEQQAAMARVRDLDGYNWGYDPFHYGVPEGSYSTDPDGSARVLEFREMVSALSGMGLRVVMDVVYNHTNSAGLADKSVLDKVVPGYYHRLNADGRIETSTCCQNTATEHFMMERLMIDDLVHWARDYKVDAFRFDLMGHHMKSNMENARDALHALTVEADGVDGPAIYLYGEGWDFGEVGGGKLGVNATQMNMAGTGIGCFNDRMRDAVRGGSAFSDRREQGFVTGLFTAPSGYNRDGGLERATLLNQADRIRVGLAGNLKSYEFVDRTGRPTTGGQFEGVGFAEEPQEAIAYISAHDNETWFDKIQYAAPAQATMAERVRMQMMGLSIVSLSQGVPFFHAGSELLRSKSMEADSYNAGDWFNRLDWSYETNNFAVGLPSAEKNRDRWNIIGPILAREGASAGQDEILACLAHFKEMLRIRQSSRLFRLPVTHCVKARLKFHNTGPSQIPGLIVMSLSDEIEGLPSVDEQYAEIVVLFNATPEEQSFATEAWSGMAFELHPILAGSADPLVQEAQFDAGRGTFTVPARTTAVFVR